ncbi:MAG: type II secretion system F family protein [Chloroflexi bacterium]|nr:type II secretion system F family protein [Chloroflexota bacterium]
MGLDTFLVFISLGIGGILLMGGLFFLLQGNEDIEERLKNYALYESLPSVDVNQQSGRFNIHRFRIRINTVLGALYSDELNQKLISANWPITVTEFLIIKYLGTILVLLISLPFVGNIPPPGRFLPPIGVAMLAYIIPSWYLTKSLRIRRAKFQNQLVDVLILIGGAVRVGYSLLQSLDVVVEEMASPSSDEFRRVRREVELGLSLKQALLHLAGRMVSDDLNLVVTAVNINTQVGGNLTTMLTAVTATIRDRIRLFGEIRVLTSYARYSSGILTLLPVIVTGIMFILNPQYIGRLFEPGWIFIIPGLAVLGMILGNIWIRRLSKIDV